MIAKYYGKNYSLETLREKTSISREGVSLWGIAKAAEQIGFHALGARVGFEILCEAPLPCIVHWKQEHFVVVYDIKINKKYEGKNLKGYVRVSVRDRNSIS
jgi:ATP-binding cassette subfamily B protein